MNENKIHSTVKTVIKLTFMQISHVIIKRYDLGGCYEDKLVYCGSTRGWLG